MEEKKITHIVNCAQGKRFGQVDTTAEDYVGADISYLGIPGHDSIKFDITPYFTRAADFIREGCCEGWLYTRILPVNLTWHGMNLK